MFSPAEGAKQDPLHWMCRPLDGKQKLNLGDLYKAGIVQQEDGGGEGRLTSVQVLRSCTEDRRKSLTFERKGPYAFQLYTPLDREPRCLAIDLFFEEPTTVVEIRLRNHYVAYLSVLMKFANHREWEMVVQQRQLMPHPHYEAGSRSYFEVTPSPPPLQPSNGAHSATWWSEVSEIRLVLQQPSANWKRFYVENLAVYGEARGPDSGKARAAYLTHLMQKTTEELRMERKNERRVSSAIPFHIGTHGYEIDKLHKF